MRNILTLTSKEIKKIDEISQKRFQNAKANSKQFTYGNKPPPKNHKRDTLGLSGEWILKKFFIENNIEIIMDTTEDITPRKSYEDKGDFKIKYNDKEYTIEVKTTSCYFGANLLIPKHKKKNPCDLYCLVKKIKSDVWEISGFVSKEKAFNFLDKGRASPCYATHEDLLESFFEII